MKTLNTGDRSNQVECKKPSEIMNRIELNISYQTKQSQTKQSQTKAATFLWMSDY